MKIKLIIALGSAALFLSSCGRAPEGTSSASGDWAQGEREGAPTMAVEGVEVSSGAVLQSIVASGTVEGRMEATVVSETQGVLTFVAVGLGEYVEEGQALAGVDSTIAESLFQEAQAADASAKLDLDATQRRFQNGTASQAELTRARSLASGAQARLQQAEKTFRDRTIRAPISGYIAELGGSVGVGNFLQPGTPVARIVDLDSLKMEVGVGERELQYLSQGAVAYVTVPSCHSEDIAGRVASIGAGADQRTGSFPVIVEWDNVCEGTIRSGVSASLRIQTSIDTDDLIIPGSAVRTVSGRQFVFVSVDGTVQEVDVQLGERLGNRVFVTSGLSAGDIVITSALTSLTDGAEVTTTVVGRTGDVL